MTSDFTDLDARIQAAKADLGEVIAQTERELIRFRRDNQPTAEDLRALQDAARRGDLGDDMRELANRIDRRQDSWAAVFSGDSPNAGLLRGHLDRMIAENREAIETAIEEDPDFDPFPPDQAL
ncbi:MAG TPA: hypothetical protein VGJ13_20200 [Pseudonocardiaceae bacterium]|jgi:hypothetical protein